MSGVKSIGQCSSMCSLDTGSCQLFVYANATGICNFGRLDYSMTVVAPQTGSDIMWTRKCEYLGVLQRIFNSEIKILTKNSYLKGDYYSLGH